MEPDVSIPVKNNHSQDAVVVVLLVISNTETLQGSGSAELPPAYAQGAPCKEVASAQGSRSPQQPAGSP